jgi:hypothetical protein
MSWACSRSRYGYSPASFLSSRYHVRGPAAPQVGFDLVLQYRHVPFGQPDQLTSWRFAERHITERLAAP